MTEEKVMTSMPRIGDMAPDFMANTTIGPVQFSDYAKDSWVVLFSHPADFTPVCTTEMSGFAERKGEFDALGTKLMGLSIDSVHAHLGWVNNVEKNTGVYFDFPIIADIDMKVSKLYGMLQPNESETAAVRASVRKPSSASRATGCPVSAESNSISPLPTDRPRARRDITG